MSYTFWSNQHSSTWENVDTPGPLSCSLSCREVGVTASWCILATILSPVKYLPYGTAVIIFGVVVVTLWKATLLHNDAI